MSAHSTPPLPRQHESAGRRASGSSGIAGAFELLSSMRFAIALLVVLAIASIIGTVLTQGDPYPNYVNQFGPFWADIFRALGLYGVYGAWWFMLILIFLVVSISLCVLRNAPKMLADAKNWKDRVRENSLRAFHHKAEYVAITASRNEVAARLAALTGKMGYRYVMRVSEELTRVSAQAARVPEYAAQVAQVARAAHAAQAKHAAQAEHAAQTEHAAQAVHAAQAEHAAQAKHAAQAEHAAQTEHAAQVTQAVHAEQAVQAKHAAQVEQAEQVAATHAARKSAQSTPQATLIAARRGALARFGYIFAHVAIVVICAGGLLDSSLPVKFQMWVLGKRPVPPGAMMASPGPEHRLSASNPSFRGDAWVPEGQSVSSAFISEPDGVLVQDLPFSILLNKFTVDYYSTGMPRLFASDIVVIDRATGARIPARVEVNKPFTYKGVSIYQSSFQDGGSLMQMSAYPMRGAGSAPFALKGDVNGAALPLPGTGGETVEITGFRAINVEDLPGPGDGNDGHGAGDASSAQPPAQSAQASFGTRLATMLDRQLGSGAKSSTPMNLHNVGPSFQYRVRDASGQASEYNNYMRPVTLDGERVFLAGVRTRADEPFRYIRIPADANDSIDEWMRVRAALADPDVRAQAARRFARQTLADSANDALRTSLEDSARRALDLFAGASGTNGTSDADGVNGASGASSTSGANGMNGASGISDADGMNGVSGTNGTSGAGGMNSASGMGGNGTNSGTGNGISGGINGDTSGSPGGGTTGDTGDDDTGLGAADARAASGGFQAVEAFLEHSVPQAERQKVAGLFMRMLEGVTWDVWQIARERAHEPPAPSIEQDADAQRFVQSSLNAFSDSFLYGAPVYLKLDAFQQVQASVFELTRAPGTMLVYAGSLLLVAGIFSMFYVRERRLWFWLKDTPAGTSVVMAMSCARKSLDFERDFEQMRAATSAALGVAPRDAGSRAQADVVADALDAPDALGTLDVRDTPGTLDAPDVLDTPGTLDAPDTLEASDTRAAGRGHRSPPDAPDTPGTAGRADTSSDVPATSASACASPAENADSSTSSIR